jgi:1,4-dihydroxy-2-naphthoate octaprenyltransferase
VKALSVFTMLLMHLLIVTVMANLTTIRPVEYLLWVTLTTLLMIQSDLREIRSDTRETKKILKDNTFF